MNPEFLSSRTNKPKLFSMSTKRSSLPHNVEDDVGRKFGDLKFLEEIFFVGVVLALCLPVELGQEIVLKFCKINLLYFASLVQSK